MPARSGRPQQNKKPAVHGSRHAPVRHRPALPRPGHLRQPHPQRPGDPSGQRRTARPARFPVDAAGTGGRRPALPQPLSADKRRAAPGTGGPRLPRERYPAIPRLLLAGAARRTSGIPPRPSAHLRHGALSGDPPPARRNRNIARAPGRPGGARSLGRYGKHRPQPRQGNPEQLELAVGALLRQLPRAR